MSSPIRVGVDMSILRHPHTGSARYATGLVRALREQDGLKIVTWKGPVRHRGGPLRKITNLLRERWWYDRELPRLAATAQTDVLLMPVNLSARPSSVPQVISILDVNFLSQPGTYDRGYTMYARRAFARSVRVASRLTTISEYSRSEIVRQLGAPADSITVVYPGLDPAPSLGTTLSPLHEPYALYVGATEPHKNVGLLINAWRGGSPAGLRLAIVGQPGRDHERLRELAATLGDRIVLVGPVSAGALEQWYRSASVFLFPSRTEGFGYPPLEAMARGIPVVAANAGALPEILGRAALLHDPDDVEAVRAHVELLAHDPGRRAELIALGAATAAKYTWSESALTMVEILRRATT